MGQSRIVGQVDQDGVLHEGAALALIFPKRVNGFRDGWLAMAQPALMALAQSDLSGEAMRVLFAVLARLDFENWIQLNQAELAASIGMTRQNFGRAVRALEAQGVLLRGPKVGKSLTYRLNPSFGWKGSAKGHNAALMDRMKARGMSVVEPTRDPRTVDVFTGKTDAELTNGETE